MKIISFTGKSGTGKSYQANRLCMENNIAGIIDDGLFIYKGQVVAGSSAKRCESKAAAMRIALFNLPENSEPVKEAIKKYNPDKLMIIGTSDKMVDWIINALELHPVDERWYIEDFTSEDDRAKAQYHRQIDGEHVIPAPMGQLKRDFAGYTMNPVKFFKNLVKDMASFQSNQENQAESTIVRPKYSYIGTFVIEPRVIRDITHIVAQSYSNELSILKVMQHGGTSNLSITISLRTIRDREVIDCLDNFQEGLCEAIETMTSFRVSAVNLLIEEFAESKKKLIRKRII